MAVPYTAPGRFLGRKDGKVPRYVARSCDYCAHAVRHRTKQAARARFRRPLRRHSRRAERHHRCEGCRGRPHHADFRQRTVEGRHRPGAHRCDRGCAARKRFQRFSLRRMVHPQRQWRDDRHHLGGRIRVFGRPRHDHQYPQRRRGARCRDCLAGKARASR